MKVKVSHVSNSSSCSYITYVPKGIDVLKLAEQEHQFKEDLNHIIKKFLQEIPGNDVRFNYDEDDNYIEYENGIKYCYKVVEILRELGFPVEFDDRGPENEPIIKNFATNKNVEKIKKIHKLEEAMK